MLARGDTDLLRRSARSDLQELSDAEHDRSKHGQRRLTRLERPPKGDQGFGWGALSDGIGYGEGPGVAVSLDDALDVGRGDGVLDGNGGRHLGTLGRERGGVNASVSKERADGWGVCAAPQASQFGLGQGFPFSSCPRFRRDQVDASAHGRRSLDEGPDSPGSLCDEDECVGGVGRIEIGAYVVGEAT